MLETRSTTCRAGIRSVKSLRDEMRIDLDVHVATMHHDAMLHDVGAILREHALLAGVDDGRIRICSGSIRRA